MVTQNACMKIWGFFLEKKNRFVTALDLIKCLKQIKLHKFLLTCGPIFESSSVP